MLVKELWCGKCDKHTLWIRNDINYPIAAEFECSKCETSLVTA